MYEDEGAAGEAWAVLDREVVRTAPAVGSHLASVYLYAPGNAVSMAVGTGMAARMAWPWWRWALASDVPVAEAIRECHPVWVGGQQEMAERYPRASLAFPFPASMYVAPLVLDGTCWGAFLLVWPASRMSPPSGREERQISGSCLRMAEALRRADESGEPLRPGDEPRSLPLPPPLHSDPGLELLERLPGGILGLDLEGRVTFVDATAGELLERDAEGPLGIPIWEVLSWLWDPAAENAYLFATVSRRPTNFTGQRPDGTWLAFVLHPGETGVTMQIAAPEVAPEGEQSLRDPPVSVPAHSLFRLLHLISALAEATGVQEVAESLVEQMMPVLDAQGLLLLIADEGRIRVVVSHGFPPAITEHMRDLPLSAGTEGVQTLESGVASFHTDNTALRRDFPDIEKQVAMSAYAFLPLTVSGRTIGTFVLGYDKPRQFPPEERAELTSLSWMIAQALERARLHDVSAGAARGLQVGLLPRTLPIVEGLEVAARYRAATHTLDVGGDFYDVIRTGEDSVAAVIGDVQGHSASAAALMGQVRAAVHTHVQAGAPPEDVLFRVNGLLTDFGGDLFASCVCAHLDLPRRRALVASAGHPAPILSLPEEGSRVLDLPEGLLLGIDPDIEYRSAEVPLPPGSLLVLYTDGLIERPGIDMGSAMRDLADHIAQTPPGTLDGLCENLLSRSDETMREGRGDDVALLLLRPSNLGTSIP
ncbi:SpoIIE family protein phosphatase [Streptomyces sp. NPDC051217]|uniref:SpoIIE family protein phosphatase n=1 Tax=Streptomyces sp. NPDC051217 TaxID=3365644 RepID=UPI0037A2EF6B